MLSKVLLVFGLSLLFVLLDLYVFQAIKTLTNDMSAGWRKVT